MENLMEIWNNTIEKNDRILEPRSRVFASEIGGSMIDRYLKMKAVPYTNPPNSRSMRKFTAGDIWEWIVKIVLVKAGIPFTTQDKVLLEYENLLPISGRLDFIIGGKTDYDEALKKLEEDDIPEFLKNPARALILKLSEIYPTEIPTKIIEIKSLGSFVFESVLAMDNPKTHHMYQAGVYALGTGLPADIVYVCRDDVRILQYNINGILPQLEIEIKKDLELITDYHRNDIEPPKEDLILWDGKKFQKNWKVEYSVYLTKLYSYTDEEEKEIYFKTPEEYREWVDPIVSAWNRIVKRLLEDKELTKSNEEYIEKMLVAGFDIKELCKHLKVSSEQQESIPE